MKHNWKEPAEAFCRAKGVEKIVYQNKRHLYDLSDLGDDVVIGLFDEEGFMITRVGDLTRDWGLGYFPSGIKGLSGYISKKQFDAVTPKGKS